MHARDERGPRRPRPRDCDAPSRASSTSVAAATGTRISANAGFCAVRTPSNRESRSRSLAAEHQRRAEQREVEDLDMGLVDPPDDRTARQKDRRAGAAGVERAHHANTASSAMIDDGERVVPMQSDRANDGQYGGDDKRVHPEVMKVLAPVSRDERRLSEIDRSVPGQRRHLASDYVDVRSGTDWAAEVRSTAAPWRCTRARRRRGAATTRPPARCSTP